jgi:hypothetical protein
MKLGIQVEAAIGDHPDKRSEIASRVSDPVRASSHVVRMELEDVKHRGCGANRPDLLDGFEPGAPVGPDGPSKSRANDHEIVDREDFLIELPVRGADLQKQPNGDGLFARTNGLSFFGKLVTRFARRSVVVI